VQEECGGSEFICREVRGRDLDPGTGRRWEAVGIRMSRRLMPDCIAPGDRDFHERFQ
jgi:hypothetical protein